MSKQTDLLNLTDAITVDSSNNVGIGTSFPSADLEIASNNPNIQLTDTDDSGYSQIRHNTGSLIFEADKGNTTASSAIRFDVDGSEAARIDESGSLLLGKTSADTSLDGFEVLSTGRGSFRRSGGTTLFVDRVGTDGTIITLRKDGSSLGSIGNDTTALVIDTVAGNGGGIGLRSTDVLPRRNGAYFDNGNDLGDATFRWDDIYATNGTIQTSDRNEKQDIEALSDAEQRVAVACKGLLRKFRWIDAVAEKGDDARIHFGIIAQDLQDAFAAEGLDAGRYAMFISSTWWETQTEVPAVEADEENGIEAKEAYTRTDTYETLEEAPEGATERTRLGVRYPELLAFIIGAM